MNPQLHIDLPRFVAFGEAKTNLVRVGPDRWRSVCGGGPWRVAVAMSALGERSAFAGSISHDVFGESIWQASVDANLDLRFLQQVAKPPLLRVVAQPGLHRTPSPLIGNDSADLAFRPEALPVGWVRALRWAHFGSASLARPPLAERLVQLAGSLKVEGKRISYDPNFRPGMDARYDETLERMCAIADLIKVSEDDLRGLFRTEDPAEGLAKIGSWNPNACLLLTRGAAGATLYRGAAEWHAQPPRADLTDTAGAGDAMMAGLLYSMMNYPEARPPQHLRWSVAARAAASASADPVPLAAQQVASLAERTAVQPGR
ncbi:carbohydrate kinase [Pelomonas sp. KK5]|uniref:carbohydrate kinase family protein n=1 Tax=Pelomonas sp. KK5 TaxID=1855730 RepID=UPI00097C8EB5|nr:carbohydrate kinase [Pelomonas sp. KK5]